MITSRKSKKKSKISLNKVKRRPKADIYNCGYCKGNGFNLKFTIDIEDGYDKWDNPFTQNWSDNLFIKSRTTSNKETCSRCKGSGLLNRILPFMYEKQMTIFNTVDICESKMISLSDEIKKIRLEEDTKVFRAIDAVSKSKFRNIVFNQITIEDYIKKIENDIKDIIE